MGDVVSATFFSAPDLAVGLETGAVGGKELALLGEALAAVSVEDEPLASAIDAYSLFHNDPRSQAKMCATITQLLRDPRRAKLSEKIALRFGHLKLFAPREQALEQVSHALVGSSRKVSSDTVSMGEGGPVLAPRQVLAAGGGTSPPPPTRAKTLLDSFNSASNRAETQGRKVTINVDEAAQKLLADHFLSGAPTWAKDVEDLFANLLNHPIYSSAPRRDPLAITINATLLPNGSIQITVSDDARRRGSGVSMSNILRTLDHSGTLLWTRGNINEGMEYRFVLPAHLLRRRDTSVGRTEKDTESDLGYAIEEGFVGAAFRDSFQIEGNLLKGKVLAQVARLAEQGNMNAAYNILHSARDNMNKEAYDALASLDLERLAEKMAPADFELFASSGCVDAVFWLFKFDETPQKKYFTNWVTGEGVFALPLINSAEKRVPRAPLAVLLLAAGGNTEALAWARERDWQSLIQGMHLSSAEREMLAKLK